jgi:hypothetical protein
VAAGQAARSERNAYGVVMPSAVLIIICVLLVVAGLVSFLAAIMGNPIRFGSRQVPGPDGSVERAAAGVVGVVAFVALVPVLIIGLSTPDAPGEFGGPVQNVLPFGATPSQSAPTSGEATPGATTPPPRTATAAPGQKTATAVTVTLGAASGCSRTASATVQVTNGPATVTYAIYVNGVARTPAPAPVTGSGSLHLASTPVSLAVAGKVEYRILSPNLLSDSRTWTVGSGCAASLALSAPSVSGDCATGLNVGGTLTVTGPGSLDVTYHLVVTGGSGNPADHSGTFPVGSSPLVADSVTAGPGGMTFTYTASSGSLTATSAPSTKDCAAAAAPAGPASIVGQIIDRLPF